MRLEVPVLRLMRPMIVLVLAGPALVQEVRAQIPYNLNYDYYPRTSYYPLNYKLYGWSGWGVPPQIEADLVRGMGIYAQAATQANSRIQATKVERRRDEMTRRWNTFVWSAEHALNLYRLGGRLPEKASEAAAPEAELARLRDRPGPEEIESGAALNALLDQFTDPRLPAEAMRNSRTPLDPKVIRKIPYDYASDVITILLERLTGDERWPRQLAIPALAGPRRDLRTAIQAAVDEDRAGPLGEAAVRAIHLAVRELANAAGRAIPPATPQYATADTYLKELTGLARLIGRPDFDPVLAALDDQTQATVEDLLGFMSMFNLRFGTAATPEQKEVYETLYPILSRWRSDLQRRLKGPLPQGGVTLSGLRQQAAPALLVFAAMSWDQLTGRPPGGGPAPGR